MELEGYQPHEQRVIVENKELGEKVTALSKFLTSDSFEKLAVEDKELLKAQHKSMFEYWSILGQRIDRFIKQ